MEQQYLMAVTLQFKQVFSESRLNELGKAVGFCQRQREVTSYQLVLSLLNTLSVGKVMSTQKVAMSMQHVLSDMLYVLLHVPAPPVRMIERGLHYLAHNAQRAHLKRDEHKGRLKLGLQPGFMDP